jgi:hypothetical protein
MIITGRVSFSARECFRAGPAVACPAVALAVSMCYPLLPTNRETAAKQSTPSHKQHIDAASASVILWEDRNR